VIWINSWVLSASSTKAEPMTAVKSAHGCAKLDEKGHESRAGSSAPDPRRHCSRLAVGIASAAWTRNES
jgi:hypothetical protein